eukprot:CAMPEP_0181212782 /NCGR_PEP_ID=MMETSP1096-20121128/24542_1 /TAXON_ID=156174 ORGANISM="Chrysochromulina ericina, Strain CCMP281" /NCGR_SAMPLE_ID=MMETSP1096 /ASSEMBLY_ACC=CAM_ASM_000453 /LENGTH=31 /DNA_ID= /DNA_START= /DNA_END= /DNA_ORIENTATION=
MVSAGRAWLPNRGFERCIQGYIQQLPNQHPD